MLYNPISLKDQPLYISGNFAPYSALAASGATGGQAELKLEVLVDESAAQLVTQRIKVYNSAGIVGDNTIQEKLDTSRNTNALVIYVTADSNLNYVTFRANKEVEIEQVSAGSLIAEDQYLTVSGHQAGLFNLRVTPFVANASTYFDINLASAVTIRVYQFET